MSSIFVPPDSNADSSAAAIDPLQPAAFFIRLCARLVDWAVIFAVMFATMFFAAMIATIAGESAFVDAMEKEEGCLSTLFGLLVQVAYHAVFEGVAGTTIGKQMTGLQVVSTDSAPLRFKQGFYRSVAFVIDSFFFGLVAASSMRESPIQQRLGDKWADTRVVYRRSVPEAQRPHGFLVFAAAVAALCVVMEIMVLNVAIDYVLLK